MNPSDVVGLTAAGLAAYAYVPQISHLVRERCTAGLSERAYSLWLGSAFLMTIHAVSIGSVVFIVLGGQQILATGVVASFCRRYRGQACPSHEQVVTVETTVRDARSASQRETLRPAPLPRSR